MKSIMLFAVALLLTLPLGVNAQTKSKVTKAQAEQAALSAVKGGKILSGEYEKENGKYIWSFDIRQDEVIKEVWVDPVSGMVIKIQTESAANEKKERSEETEYKHGSHAAKNKTVGEKAIISKSQAEAIAMKAVPGGKVTEAELEHESGLYIWSMDVQTPKGTKEVWVSPKTGKVLKVFVENESKEGRKKD